MSDESEPQRRGAVGRRGFLGGVTAALIGAYSADVPERVAAQVTGGDDSPVQSVTSPDGSIELTVDVSSGVPEYSLSVGGTTYLEPSPIGFNFAEQATFGTGISGTGPDLTVTGSQSGTATESWSPTWGEYDGVSEEYGYLTLGLEETAAPGRSANLRVRVFNDGIGFRVVLDEEFGDFVVTSENTEFNFGGDYTAWWISNAFLNPRFEQEYTESALSEIPAGSVPVASSDGESPNGNQKRAGAHTPLTMRTDDGTYLSVHEADLADYSTLSLAAQSNDGGTKLAAELAPLPDGTKVAAAAPHATPWRTIQVGSSPGDLVESQLVPLLASEFDDEIYPTAEDGTVDTDWIAPRKYAGVWWTMIAGNANWEYKTDSEVANGGGDPAAYIHGARTERAQRYMEFASRNGLDSVLVEGWNEGWDTYPGDGTGLAMGVGDSYPDFDVGAVTDYGANLSPSVELTIHNETAGNIVNYEDEIDAGIFGEYENSGIRSIKNGYVSDPGLGFEGDGSAPSHNHHCQAAVNHHRLVIEAAAANRQLLEIHEGIKPTGEIRTYPHVATREVATAQEYDGFGALGSGVGRDHHVLLPFTRMLAGPTSYQAGIFDVTFNDTEGDQVQTTRAKQLAMYPTYHSGLQMVADRIEAYVDDSLTVGEFVHAAAGDLGGFVTADEWRNAFGTNYVAVDPNRVAEGSTLSFTVEDVPEAATYDIHLRYASDAEENRDAVINNGSPEATFLVNGEVEETITPSFTDYWDDWAIHTVSVVLEEGENTIGIELGPDDVGGFNLNAVGVAEAKTCSPVAADYGAVDPANENHATEPEFEFVEAVPAGDWDETVVVDAAVGEYVVTARRSGEEWFLGAMTDGLARDVDVSLGFLSGQPNGWAVTEYADTPGANVDVDPTAVDVYDYAVSAGESLTLSMAPSGGIAMRFTPADDQSGERPDVGIVPGETYVVENVNSRRALEVAAGSTANGANVQQYEYVGADNQRWTVTEADSGYYVLEAAHSEKALDVEFASGANGANVHQYEYGGGDNQEWAIERNDDGTYRLLARHSGKALDVEFASGADGANVQQYEYVDSDNQHWTFERV